MPSRTSPEQPTNPLPRSTGPAPLPPADDPHVHPQPGLRGLRRSARPARAERRLRLPKVVLATVLVSVLGAAGWVASLQRSGHGHVAADARNQGYELGTRFTVKSSGAIRGATLYDPRDSGDEQITLWRSDGTVLARSAHHRVTAAGWHEVTFGSAVRVSSGTDYVIAVRSDTDMPLQTEAVVPGGPVDTSVAVSGSVVSRGTELPTQPVSLPSPRVLPLFAPEPTSSSSVTPSPATPSAQATTPHASISSGPARTSASSTPNSIPSSFPNASNTGVPASTSLKPYTGDCSIRGDLVISARVVNCDLMIYSGHVTVRSSKVNGIVINDTKAGSLTIVDSEINGGTADRNIVGSYSVTILRSEIRGGEHSVQCWGNCTVQDSWLHGQYVPPNGAQHLNAFISNGGSHIKLIHNTLSCDAHITSNDGGCTADASIFGDFSANSDFTFDQNLFVASTELSYCAYGGYSPGKPYGTQVSRIVFTNNVFQRGTNGKCGLFGPVTSFKPDLPGNVWNNNVWDDGTLLTPN